MTIGILKVFLFIHDSNSLKRKRMVLNSLKARLRNNFNVSVAQLDEEDKWQKATLAIVGVGKDRRNLDSRLSDVIGFVEEFNGAQLIDYETELI